MNWLQVEATFDQSQGDWSIPIDIFREYGCDNTQILEAPPRIVGCVSDVAQGVEAVAQITTALYENGAKEVEVTTVPDEDWSLIWRQFFVPRRIGERIVVKPTWSDFEPTPEDLIIELDPGQAFGTGDHPTTRLCLTLMQGIDLSGKNVADVGCGSGILSIGAVLLGAASVEAIDIEPISVEVSKENAGLNGTEIHFETGNSIAMLPSNTFDVILSNIISATIISMAPEIVSRLAPEGNWMVSGVLRSNYPDVLATVNRLGLQEESKLEEDDWVAAVFRR